MEATALREGAGAGVSGNSGTGDDQLAAFSAPPAVKKTLPATSNQAAASTAVVELPRENTLIPPAAALCLNAALSMGTVNDLI